MAGLCELVNKGAKEEPFVVDDDVVVGGGVV